MQITRKNPLEASDSLSEMEFLKLGNFNGGEIGVFWSEPGEPSPWEMHPNCDEILQILEGEVEVEILPRDSGQSESQIVSAGSFVIIPKGCWHRQTMRARTKEVYITPGSSLHSMAPDPRLE